MDISIVLPCFNEEANIAASVEDVLQWIQHEKLMGEVIVVNDGSRDGSMRVLEGLQTKYPNVKVVSHESNQGYGIAIRTGCDSATGDIIAFMDSDGQFHAQDMSLLLPHMKDYQFVTGRRRRRADPLMRKVFGKLLAAMNWLVLGLWVRDINCGMKMFRKSIWPSIRPIHGVEKLFNTEIFLHLKQQHIDWYQVSVPHYPRTAGTPTGGSARVIIRMFQELMALKRSASKTH